MVLTLLSVTIAELLILKFQFMMIHIKWNDTVIPAYVLYDFKKIRDMIVLKLSTKERRELVLTYTGEEWVDADNLHVEQPDIFRQIMERLKSITREAERVFARAKTHNAV